MPVRARDIHVQSLATSTALSEYYVPNFITPLDVIRVLNAARVKFMLVGAHGIGGWTRGPRASKDVDILAAARDHTKVVRILLTAFPSSRAEDHEDETSLHDIETGQVLIDVMKSNQALYQVALQHGHLVKGGRQAYWIPSLELALALKLLAILSVSRDLADKYGDAGDFIAMITSNPTMNTNRLHTLGQLVYTGGGDELVKQVRQVRAGEQLTLLNAAP